MNSLFDSFCALVSGMFLSVGLERLAERCDPLALSSAGVLSVELNAALPTVGCTVASEFAMQR